MALSPCILQCKSLVIAFAGKAEHGKSAAASAIVARNPTRGIKLYGFADALKLEVFDLLLDPTDPYWSESVFKYNALPHPPERYIGKALKMAWVECNKRVLRNLLQHYGTEYRRSQDPFYWINKLRQQIEQDNPKFALITDLRMKNELYFVRACLGYTVYVERIGHVSSGNAKHETETTVDSLVYDFQIRVKDGDLDQLRYEAVKVFDQVVEDQQPILPELHAFQAS